MTDTGPIDWGKESEETLGTRNEDQLDVISSLTAEMLTLEDKIEDMEEELKALKKEHQRISQGTLPEAMLALGLTELKHISGRKLFVETFYQAKVPESMKEEAYAYLERTGNDAIIKTDLTAKFGKGEKEQAQAAFELLKAHGIMAGMKTGIHHSTLRAFVKEQIESGAPGFPQEAFGVYVGNRIKVK